MKALIALVTLAFLASTTLAFPTLTTMIVPRNRCFGPYGGLGGYAGRVPRSCREGGCKGLRRTKERFSGQSFTWTMSGIDEDGLFIHYTEVAYAPDGIQVVKMYPRDNAQLALGFKPAKVIYDYITDNPVTVLRIEKERKVQCILVSPDYATYSELIHALTTRNDNRLEVPNDDESVVRLVARETTDTSRLSHCVHNHCSYDQRGRPVQPRYFTTEAAPAEAGSDTSETATPNNDHPISVMLVSKRLTITGVPRPVKK